MSTSITKAQMQRLQVLYSQLARHTDQSTDRDARLTWASSLLQRPVSSFGELSIADARHLIDTLQGQLGVKMPAKPRRRLGREAAHRAGTAGRRADQSNEIVLAGKDDLERIQRARVDLGWSQAQFDAWLRSPRSPMRNKASAEIRTLADANRVWWALKGMLRHQGLWKERSA